MKILGLFLVLAVATARAVSFKDLIENHKIERDILSIARKSGGENLRFLRVPLSGFLEMDAKPAEADLEYFGIKIFDFRVQSIWKCRGKIEDYY